MQFVLVGHALMQSQAEVMGVTASTCFTSKCSAHSRQHTQPFKSTDEPQTSKIRMRSFTGARQDGHCLVFSARAVADGAGCRMNCDAHSPQKQRWPHGINAICAGSDKHSTHIAVSLAVTAGRLSTGTTFGVRAGDCFDDDVRVGAGE